MDLLKKTLSIFLSLALMLGICYMPVYAGETGSKIFYYRVDTLDSYKTATRERLAVEVSANFDGKVYVRANRVGDASFSAADVKKNGVATELKSGIETIAYCSASDAYVDGLSYNIYFCIEDKDGSLYGPYVEKSYKAGYFPSGEGTASNPYQIWSYRHLMNIKELNKKNVNLVLMQDIDMGYSPYTYKTIMDYASSFAGSFDGNNHSIIGLKGSLVNEIGEGGVLKNIFIAGAMLNGTSTHGILVAKQNKGKIEHCAIINSSIIPKDSTYEVGGIASINNGEITDCKVSNIEASNNSYVGGIAGTNRGKITGCYSDVKLEAKNSSGTPVYGAGGIAGRSIGGTTKACKTNNALLYGTNIGGILGSCSSTSELTGCISQYNPSNPESVMHSSGAKDGSIVATIMNDPVIANNIGTVGNPSGSYKPEEIIKWKKCHGDATDGIVIADPVQDKINEEIKSAGEGKYNYETASYNKKFPMKKLVLSGNGNEEPNPGPNPNPTPDPEHKHSWDSGKITKKPTYMEKGVKTFTCKTCGKTKTEEIAVKKLNGPKISSLSNTASNTMTVKWAQIADVNGYELQYATKNNFSNKKSLVIASNSTVSKKITKLTNNKTYYVRIRAYVKANGKKLNSSWSTSKQIKIKKIKVKKVTIPDTPKLSNWIYIPHYNSEGSGRKITWKKVKNADGYQVKKYERDSPDAGWDIKTFNVKKATKFCVSTAYATQFKVQVRAYKKVNGKIVYSKWATSKVFTQGN